MMNHVIHLDLPGDLIGQPTVSLSSWRATFSSPSGMSVEVSLAQRGLGALMTPETVLPAWVGALTIVQPTLLMVQAPRRSELGGFPLVEAHVTSLTGGQAMVGTVGLCDIGPLRMLVMVNVPGQAGSPPPDLSDVIGALTLDGRSGPLPSK